MDEPNPAAAGVARKRQANFLTVLARRDFRLLWAGQLVSQIGDAFYWLALLITVNDLTGSTKAMGVTSVIVTLPVLVIGPLAGVFVDRWDRRRTMIASDLLRAGLVLFCILVREADQIWIYWVVGFLMSAVGVFFLPAKNAVIPLLVEEDDLLPANALSQTTQTLALIVGSAAAGFVIGHIGAQAAFVADSISFLVSAMALRLIRMPQVRERAARGLRALGRQFQEGIAFIAQSRTVLALLAIGATFHLGMGAVNVLWIPFLDRYFGVGPEGIGIVDSSQGIGMLLGGAVVGNLAGRFSHSGLVSGGLLILGAVLVALAVSPTFAYILVLNGIFGLALTPMLSGLYTILQRVVPNVKLGRVNAVLGALTRLANILSMAAAGWLGDQVGIRPIYIFCGGLTMLAGALGARVLREPAPAPEPETGVATEG
ncbi:MAG: MFS transporter [Anaerolineae bacterium]|nr:MFS transporter [Anaerolineae bacterium]